jgi:dihydrofolate synthase / folylpolyglutamate synthase
MEYIAIKTRIMQPPQDDLFSLLDDYLVDVQEKDVILISSKIIAIHQGRCVSIEGANKSELIAQEADVVIETDYRPFPLTITHHTFLGAAGIDESNANGYYVLLPQRMFEVAEEIHAYLRKKHGLTEVGVVITDSRSQPFRYGAMGVSLAFWGIHPLESHVGNKDLFGRALKYERSNVVDALAAGATLVSGEVDECQPIVIARNSPHLFFTLENCKDELMVDPKEDTFRVLYERFLD